MTERCYITWIMFFVQGLSEVTYIGLVSCSGAVICLINENWICQIIINKNRIGYTKIE